MIDFFERLDKFMNIKGLNDNKITVLAGISNGLIGKARKRGSLSQDNISKILETFPELDANWLLTGEGTVFKNSKTPFKEVTKPISLYSIDKSLAKQQPIPLYNLEASAGIVTLFQDNTNYEPVDYISIPNLPKSDGALYVTGDSMYPLLKSGDIVIYKQIETDIENIFWGEMYLISVDLAGDITTFVKWIQKSEQGSEFVKLVSQNQHHQAKDIHISKIKALALVKASIRINSMN